MCWHIVHRHHVVPPDVADTESTPLAWRRRLAQDGALLGKLTRIFVETVNAFYAKRAGDDGARTDAVTVVQRTSSDLQLNPHLHVVLLDGAYGERGGALVFRGLGHLRTSPVGEVLERVARRIARYLRHQGIVVAADGASNEGADQDGQLAASEPPPPRFPLVRYHGVLAPKSSYRARVVPRPTAEMHAACAKLSKVPQRSGGRLADGSKRRRRGQGSASSDPSDSSRCPAGAISSEPNATRPAPGLGARILGVLNGSDGVVPFEPSIQNPTFERPPQPDANARPALDQ